MVGKVFVLILQLVVGRFRYKIRGLSGVNARDNMAVKLIYCSYDQGEDIYIAVMIKVRI